MPRAKSIQTAADRKDGTVADTLILPFARRQVKQGFLFGVKGTCVEIDFPDPVRLRTDDALVLEDGSLIEVVAEAEPLFEVRAADVAGLSRLAWHLGDRHVPIQILERRLRFARDPAIEAMLQSLGVKVAAIEAPFEPEGGAYEASGGHDHDHRHHDHDHGHDHHHGHDHDHDHCDHDHGHHHSRKHEHGKS